MTNSLWVSAAALCAASGAVLGALTPKDMVSDNQFWLPCAADANSVTPIGVQCDMSWPPFWQASLITDTERCNCGTTPMHRSIGLTVGMEGKFSVKRTVCNTELQFELSSKVEIASTDDFDIPPCKCVGYMFWRQLAVSAITEVEQRWVCNEGSWAAGTGAPNGYPVRVPVRRYRLQSLTPMRTPPVRTEYPITSPCVDCPGSPAPRPDQVSALMPPPQILALAGTANDWYTKLDCMEFFKPIEPTSAFDLCLYELRGLGQKVEAELALHPSGTIELILSDKVVIKGDTAAVARDLRTMALLLVDSKAYGDFNEDGVRNAADFAILSDAVYDPPGSDVRLFHRLDLNADGAVDEQDATLWTSLQPS